VGPSTRSCPRGHGLLQRARTDSVEVDSCEACHGIHLDGGELGRLRRGGNPIGKRVRILDSDANDGMLRGQRLGLLFGLFDVR
jgi:Zn-finger nucleic acid-binding protein